MSEKLAVVKFVTNRPTTCNLQLRVKCFVVCTENANFACPCFECKASTHTGHSAMISVSCLGLLYASVYVSKLNGAVNDMPQLRLLERSQLSLADSLRPSKCATVVWFAHAAEHFTTQLRLQPAVAKYLLFNLI